MSCEEATYSFVTWQTVLFWPEHSHLMAGLKLPLSSMTVPSVAAPVQGSPLMFHDDDAVRPSLANTAFTAAAAKPKTGSHFTSQTNGNNDYPLIDRPIARARANRTVRDQDPG